MKLVLFLEKSEIVYQPLPINIGRGEQHKPEYLTINPNGKVPTIKDDNLVMFDSSANSIHLADKYNKFLSPEDNPQYRASMLSWVIFAGSGMGPFTGRRRISSFTRPSRVDLR